MLSPYLWNTVYNNLRCESGIFVRSVGVKFLLNCYTAAAPQT